MSSKILQIHIPKMTTGDWLKDGAFLALALFLSAAFFTFSYWAGLLMLALTSLLFISFSTLTSLARGLLVMGWVFFFTALGVGSVAQTWFLNNSPSAFSTISSRFDSNYLLLSGILGVLSGAVVVTVLILATFWVAARALLDWHEHQDLSLGEVLGHMVQATLGIHRPAVQVIGKELQGSDSDLHFLETIGGPGWLQIYPGQYVVLHRWGKITRLVEAGSVMLKSQEQVKAILPTGGDGGGKIIFGVTTRDKIKVDVKISYAAKIMTATDIDGSTNDKLKQFSGGDRLGDHYVEVLKKVAGAAPKVAEFVSGAMESEVRDVFMSMNFEDLFALSERDLSAVKKLSAPLPSENDNGQSVRVAQDSENEEGTSTSKAAPTNEKTEEKSPEPWLETLCDSRPIRKIERHILENVKKAKLGDGIAVLNFDITGLDFPDDIAEKAAEEIKAQIESRIRVNVARAKLAEAKAIAHIRTLHGRGEGEAKAAQYRELVSALSRDGGQVDEEMLKALLAQPSSNGNHAS